MDSAAESSEPARRTDSPEPNSTRPNPFDDTEAAARKRRRTSLSGSPSRSVNDSDSARNKSSVTPPSVEDEASDNAMHIDRRPTTPQTPEQQLVSEQHSPEPPSSRVTINLRKTPRDDTTIPLSLSAAGGVSFESDQQNQRMVRTSPSPSPSPNEMDQIEPGSRSSHTSTLSSQSPPVELIAVQDSEDDISLGPPIEEVSMEDQGRYLMDPTDDFPYQETHEHPYDTVQRLVHYITQNPLLDENIIQTTQRWLRDFLRYIRDTDHIRVKNSLQMNKRLWATYPEIIHAMKSRK
jgi:ubiquitin carboxyl-terminal hydrolase 34